MLDCHALLATDNKAKAAEQVVRAIRRLVGGETSGENLRRPSWTTSPVMVLAECPNGNETDPSALRKGGLAKPSIRIKVQDCRTPYQRNR